MMGNPNLRFENSFDGVERLIWSESYLKYPTSKHLGLKISSGTSNGISKHS